MINVAFLLWASKVGAHVDREWKRNGVGKFLLQFCGLIEDESHQLEAKKLENKKEFKEKAIKQKKSVKSQSGTYTRQLCE